MPHARNIAAQIDAWQRRKRLSDAAAAAELEVLPVLFMKWKAGTPCPYAAILETKMEVPVQRVTRSPGGIIGL